MIKEHPAKQDGCSFITFCYRSLAAGGGALPAAVRSSLLEDSHRAGDPAPAQGIVCVGIPGGGKKLGIGVRREFTLKAGSRPADEPGDGVSGAPVRPVHIGGDHDLPPGPAYPLQLLQGQLWLVQQVDHVGGDDGVKAGVGVGQVQDVGPLKADITAAGQLFPRPLQHIFREICGYKAFAPGGDRPGEQSCAAGALQHIVLGGDQRRHRGAQLLVGPSVDAVGKNIIGQILCGAELPQAPH